MKRFRVGDLRGLESTSTEKPLSNHASRYVIIEPETQPKGHIPDEKNITETLVEVMSSVQPKDKEPAEMLIQACGCGLGRQDSHIFDRSELGLPMAEIAALSDKGLQGIDVKCLEPGLCGHGQMDPEQRLGAHLFLWG